MVNKKTWFRSDIQGLRAIAVLAVIGFHYSNVIPGGFIGVDIFFVISGFVISGLLTRNISDGKSLSNFLITRFWRLVPSLSCVILITSLISPFVLSPFRTQYETSIQGIAGLLSFANYILWHQGSLYFLLDSSVTPLRHLWSISVEDQMYIFITICYFFAKLPSNKNYFIDKKIILKFIILVSGSTSLLLAIFTPPLAHVQPHFLSSFYSPLLRWWEFSAGVALYLFVGSPPKTRRNYLLEFFGFLGLASLLVLFFHQLNLDSWPNSLTIIPILCTVFVISSGPNSFVNYLMTFKPLRFIGDHSYGLYLWHWPLLVFSQSLIQNKTNASLIALFMTFILSILSKRFIENPISLKRLNFHGSLIGPIALLFFPIVISSVLLFGSYNGWGNKKIQSANYQFQQSPIGYEEGCVNHNNSDEGLFSGCLWNSFGIKKPFYLIGDSMAGQWTNVLIEIGLQESRPVGIHLYNSCPFIKFGEVNRPEFINPECEVYVKRVLKELASSGVGTVIIGMSPNYINSSNELRYEKAYIETLKTIRAMGHQVVLLGPTPQFYPWAIEKCSAYIAYVDISACGTSLNLAELNVQQKEFNELLKNASLISGVRTINLNQIICDGENCSTNIGNEWRVKDAYHLSLGFTKKLTMKLKQSLDSNLE